jgi:hypothetical protein
VYESAANRTSYAKLSDDGGREQRDQRKWQSDHGDRDDGDDGTRKEQHQKADEEGTSWTPFERVGAGANLSGEHLIQQEPKQETDGDDRPDPADVRDDQSTEQ